MTLRKEHRVWMFETTVLRKMSGPKREAAASRLKKIRQRWDS